MNATTRQQTLNAIKALQSDRAKLVAELATMPKFKQGTTYHNDRENLRRNITAQISTLTQTLWN